jgi:hypothetical protein
MTGLDGRAPGTCSRRGKQAPAPENGWSYYMSLLHRFGLMTLAAVFAVGTAAQAANVNLPAGSTIDATIQQEMNSKTAQDGQAFSAVTSSGSRIRGHLSEVARANIGRKAHLKLNVDTITFNDGTTAPINAEVIGVGTKKQTNYLQAGGTVLGGMVVGNIIGKALGTGLGGLVGVAGGALLAANTSSNIDVPSGSQLRLKLNAPLVVRSQAR